MKHIFNLKGPRGFLIKMLICSFFSILTALVYTNLLLYQLKNQDLKISCKIKSSSPLSIDLYTDFGNGFNEKNKITNNLSTIDSMALFSVVKQNGGYLKKIRLDFNTMSDTVHLKSLVLLKDDKPWISLNSKDIFEKVKFVSEGSRLLYNKKYVGVKVPILGKDTYLSFTNSYNLITSNFIKSLLLLWPWFLLGLIMLDEHRKYFKKENIFLGLLALFIFSIFLKESLSTFSVILIGVFAIINIIRTRTISVHKEQLGFLFLFVAILVFGRIQSYDQINIQLGLCIIPLFLALSNQNIHKIGFYEFYCNVLLLFMSILIVGFIISVFINKEVEPLYFIENKKYIIGNITYWLGYKNPTFLSFFALIGLSIYQYLFKDKRINSVEYIVFATLVFLILFLLGSRLALIVYFIILLTNVFTIKWRSRIYFLVFLSLSIYIYINIEYIDEYRFLMWNEIITTYNGSFIGNGLGSTEDLFLNYNNEYFKFKINHAHNQYITYLYELGIMGQILLFCFFLYYGIIYFRSKQAERLSILFLLLVLMITESPFESTKPLYVFTFFICLKFTNSKKVQ